MWGDRNGWVKTKAPTGTSRAPVGASNQTARQTDKYTDRRPHHAEARSWQEWADNSAALR
eukprot:4140059-Pyramimonas_sp.AAC.1